MKFPFSLVKKYFELRACLSASLVLVFPRVLMLVDFQLFVFLNLYIQFELLL